MKINISDHCAVSYLNFLLTSVIKVETEKETAVLINEVLVATEEGCARYPHCETKWLARRVAASKFLQLLPESSKAQFFNRHLIFEEVEKKENKLIRNFLRTIKYCEDHIK